MAVKLGNYILKPLSPYLKQEDVLLCLPLLSLSYNFNIVRGLYLDPGERPVRG